jgi:hypothetical protein
MPCRDALRQITKDAWGRRMLGEIGQSVSHCFEVCDNNNESNFWGLLRKRNLV